MGGDLTGEAQTFAQQLTETLQGTVGETAPQFVAEASPLRLGDVQRAIVHPSDAQLIPLTITGDHALDLEVSYTCELDHLKQYLAVRKAAIKVLPAGSSVPLFRYEFVHAMASGLPSAHLHVHAHRDEFLYQLVRARKGKPSSRVKAVTGESSRSPLPKLSDVHFPLGGPRMRPVLEDVLQMLKLELEIDLMKGYQDVLDAGRARWRRNQIGTCVRDAPAEAVRVLEEMGYQVTRPAEEKAERTDQLTQL